GARRRIAERQDALMTQLTARQISRHIRDLVWPRKGAFALALALLLVNRAAGLILPGALKILIDDVVLSGRATLLYPLAGAVGAALLINAATAYALDRL